MCNPLKWLSSFTADTPVPGACSSYAEYCLTVNVLLFDTEGRLLLVRHINADRNELVPPQTTVRPTDKTLGNALQRCLREKLGLKEVDVTLRSDELNHYLNIVPARGSESRRVKGTIVFGGVLRYGVRVRPNRCTVRQTEFVEPELLIYRLPLDRSAKCEGTHHACLEAMMRGLVSHSIQQRYLRALGSID
jgi:hypothetical protein